MASVAKRNGKWFACFKASDGRHLKKALPAGTTKAEALRLANLAEAAAQEHHARVALGLASPESFATIADLLAWWLKERRAGKPGYKADASYVGKHLVPALGELAPQALTPAAIEAFLVSSGDGGYKPGTLNHLRRVLGSAISAARKVGRWQGESPVARVEKRKVLRRPPAFLRPEQARALLRAGFRNEQWRAIFATALYLGLRKGEILGLRKRDVDLELGLVTVSHSYDRAPETHKGGHGDVLPIPPELLPYLKAAIERSSSEWVFPGPRGAMRKPDTRVEDALRRALARVGIVSGWLHYCRRGYGGRGPTRSDRAPCGYRQEEPDNAQRACPRCGRPLFCRGLPVTLRFHDLRHTTATLLLMAGVPVAVVQRIMRHSDPKITTEVYGHLLPDFLRGQTLSLEEPAAAKGGAK